MFNQIGGEEGKKKTEQERDGGSTDRQTHPWCILTLT